MFFFQQIAGNGDRERYRGPEAASRPLWGEVVDGKGGSSHNYKDDGDGFTGGAGESREISNQLQQWASNKLSLTTTTTTTTESNSFKSEQLANRENSNDDDVDDQYIDYFYNNRPWWERATGGGGPGLGGDKNVFPQRKHTSDPGQAAYSVSDKNHQQHLLTKSNEVYSSSEASDSTRGSNRFHHFSQSESLDYSAPHEGHRSFSRTLTRSKGGDYLKDYPSDQPEYNGLSEANDDPSCSINNNGINSASNHIHSDSKDEGLNAHKLLSRSSPQSSSSSSSFSDFISNWTTDTIDNSKFSSHDLSTLSHDLTTTSNNTTSVITSNFTQDYNSSYTGASTVHNYNGSSGNRTESLLVDSSYELSTEFPGYISPQNISFDGSIPLALKHMFSSNFSGQACGEWNASYPLCYPGTSLNTTANASLGEPGPDESSPRYWALFLLLFPIFTVSTIPLLLLSIVSGIFASKTWSYE